MMSRAWHILRRLTDFREFIILAVIVVAGAYMTYKSPIFFTPDNILAVLLSLSFESIVAIGMTLLLVAGGFDLSVGSTVALTGAVSALCMVHDVPVIPAMLAGLAAGTCIGLVNGLIVAYVGINPFITTLGMMSILRGALLVVTQGRNITVSSQTFKLLGQGHIAGIQFPIILSLVLIVLGDLALRKSRFFRQSYYIGGNERAAILSGIAVRKVTVFNYALVGFLAGLAGLLMTARLGNASVTAGTGLELRVISAVIIGGASLQGGEGTVLGSFLGCLLMALIVNALTLLGVDVYWNTLVIGATLLAAVTIDTLVKRRKGL